MGPVRSYEPERLNKESDSAFENPGNMKQSNKIVPSTIFSPMSMLKVIKIAQRIVIAIIVASGILESMTELIINITPQVDSEHISLPTRWSGMLWSLCQ